MKQTQTIKVDSYVRMLMKIMLVLRVSLLLAGSSAAEICILRAVRIACRFRFALRILFVRNKRLAQVLALPPLG